MSDGAAERVGTGEWSGLLAETRQGLATLRVEDLEELAARAECMLRATVGDDCIRQRIPRPQARERIELTRQHRLLGDLLLATERNLAVLRRLEGREYARAGEGNARWER